MLDTLIQFMSASIVESFFYGVDESSIATYVKNATFLVPWAGSFHLLSLSLMGGAIILADLRNIGPGLQSQSPASLNKAMKPWLIVAVCVLVMSGSVLALSEMTRLLFSPPYWMKMAALASALVFTFGVRDLVIRSEGKISLPAKIFGVLSLGLYLIIFAMISSTLARFCFIGMAGVLGALVWFSGKRPEALPLSIRAVSAITIAMWLTTAVAGRWIAFW